MHRHCYDAKFHSEGSFLCAPCWKWEEAWSTEDFDYEEDDPDDEVGKAVAFRPAKKKSKKETKKREIECIDLLSSDEETEEDDSLVEVVDFDDDKYLFGETEISEFDGDPLGTLDNAEAVDDDNDEPLAFNVIYI